MVRTLVLLFVIISCQAFSQESSKTKKKDIPENIEPIHSKFSFSPFYVKEYSSLAINCRDYDNRATIYYKPNITGSIGAKIGIKNFTLSYAYGLPQDDKFGKTKLTNLILNYQRRVFGISLFYINYKGMYLANPEDFNIKYSENKYPTRLDIDLQTFGFNIQFAFNKNFSINAAFDQNERQKKTAGSFVFMFADRYTMLDADSSLIVPSEQQYYVRTKKVSDLSLNTLKVAPGAGYTFVLGHNISFTAIVLTGWGFQTKFYKLDGTSNIGIRLPFYINGKSALGYNGENIYVNLIYNVELNNIRFSDSDIALFANFLKISIGYRIY